MPYATFQSTLNSSIVSYRMGRFTTRTTRKGEWSGRKRIKVDSVRVERRKDKMG